MRALVGTAMSILLSLAAAFAQGASSAFGSVGGEVFTKSANGEPAVLPGVDIVLRGPVAKDTESDAQGAFAIRGLPPGTYEIEANAPGLYSDSSATAASVAVTLTLLVTAVTVIPTASAAYNSISQSVVEKVPNQEERIESLRPPPLNSFGDDPEIFLSEDDRKWLKAMNCAFSRKVHHA